MKKSILLFSILCGVAINLPAQIFTRVTTSTNPIVSDPVQTFYNGASWIDYDNDGLLDLFVSRAALYRNTGNGTFVKVTTSGIGLTTGIGNTWSDIDNDGDIDCLQSGGNAGGTKLYVNNGNSTFFQNTQGPFANATSLRGWGSAFGDFNNDGLVDLFIASPFGFAGITDSCKFLVNTGNGTFLRLDTTAITDTVDAFTVPSWSDFDNDGDLDLFVGAGRVNGSLSKDYLFTNTQSSGGGAPLFYRNTTSPLGTDLHDGQIWNWIDFDNDGDMDAYLTNYKGTSATGYPNEMYRNDGASFVKLTANDVGAIVTDVGMSLSSNWGDFDNDGDLDCIVTNEGQQKNCYYQNNIRQGSSVFTKILTEPFTLSNGDHWSACNGDYDNDGDLDVFISASSDKGLFLNTTTQHDFINIKLVGGASNKSAIGAKVRIKANGFWQMREISSQNTFNGMNMLNAHFGFGPTGIVALTCDSVVITWPSGAIDICTNIAANAFYVATEGLCLSTNSVMKNDELYSVKIYPNPAGNRLTIQPLVQTQKISGWKIVDKSGIILQSKNQVLQGEFTIDVSKLSAGSYFIQLYTGEKDTVVPFIKQ
ncbi:MAG TPA: FG-GAP-like repeat-containing protein [Bacteroidia bacterium]|nr:FG-GAP-like repeat-containing protein [Bacteroidia bacterium]